MVNLELIKPGKRFRNLVFIAAAAIPVFAVTSSYSRYISDRHGNDIAMLTTVYFIVCVYIGRYLSRLFIKENGTIRVQVFITLGIIIITCVILVFTFAEYTVNFNGTFLRILFIGFPFTLLCLSLGIIVKLIRTTIKNQLVEAKAVAEQSQSELRFLQNQLSPHFLFNTLNNMYGLSLTQHEKVPGLLLKLSDLLRYSVYDAKELYVPLKNELAYIKDYIEFEKIRIGDKLELNTSFEEPIDPAITVAPLLLIVFVENAFKHSKNTTDQTIYIHITLKTWANSILFSVRNSSHVKANGNKLLNENSGFGLENVTKRLDLLYKDKYDLKIEEQDSYYDVMLQLKWK